MSWPGPGTSFPGLASSPWHLVKYLVCTSQFKRNDCWVSENNKHYKQTFEHRNLSNQIFFLHSFWTHSSLILWKFFLVEGPTEKLTTRSPKAAAQNFMVAVIHSTCSPAPHPTVGPWKGKDDLLASFRWVQFQSSRRGWDRLWDSLWDGLVTQALWYPVSLSFLLICLHHWAGLWGKKSIGNPSEVRFEDLPVYFIHISFQSYRTPGVFVMGWRCLLSLLVRRKQDYECFMVCSCGTAIFQWISLLPGSWGKNKTFLVGVRGKQTPREPFSPIF